MIIIQKDNQIKGLYRHIEEDKINYQKRLDLYLPKLIQVTAENSFEEFNYYTIRTDFSKSLFDNIFIQGDSKHLLEHIGESVKREIVHKLGVLNIMRGVDKI